MSNQIHNGGPALADVPILSVDEFECRNLGIAYGNERRIVEDLNFRVRRGEFVSLVGGSGVGKTTLLRVLGGLAPAIAGSELRYQGHPIQGPPNGVVVVFQDYAASLLPWRTIEKNVGLGIERSTDAITRNAAVAEALARVGLEGQGSLYPRQLSGGMQQRVQIARALVMQPSALLMDEPFGSLDAMTKVSLQDELLRIHGETGATVIFVTHDIEEAVYLSDRILVMVGSPGRIAKEIEVDLPRPREQVTTREQSRYLELRHEVYEAIEGFRGLSS